MHHPHQVITIYQELATDPSFAQTSSKPTVTVITTNGDEDEEEPVAPESHRKLLGMKAVVGLAGWLCDQHCVLYVVGLLYKNT